MVSIKDVAKLAGVSTATVSRALTEPDKVVAKTREKVLRAVEQSGYVANTLARNFRTRKTNMVLVLVPDITNVFFASVIQGIEWVAHRNNYRVLLGDTQYNPEGERAYAELVAQKQADAVITLGCNIPFPYRAGRKTMDPNWPPFSMACEYNSDIPVPTVCIDNEQAASEVIEYLSSLGHERIAFINGPAGSPICRDRLRGYKKSMRSNGVTDTRQLVIAGDFSIASGRMSMKKLLSLDAIPSAVFAANDEMAMGAMTEIKAHGLRIPEDISIVGFDDIRFAEVTDPPLTTVRQPRHDMGKRVMTMMLGLLRGELARPQHVILPHELIVRGSACMRSNNGQ